MKKPVGLPGLFGKFVTGLDGNFMELRKVPGGTADNVIGGLKGHCLFNDEEVCAEIYPPILIESSLYGKAVQSFDFPRPPEKRLSVKFGQWIRH